MSKETKISLTNEELNKISGGSFWESEAGGGEGVKYIDLYRCGISFKNCAFTSDEYSINGVRITKEKATQIVLHGNTIWNRHKEKGDLVAFSREWKAILKNYYGINWNGEMGKYSVGF
jgi:hypothetical protein